FDELSGIETVQIMQYADRALQLGQELFGDDIEEGFLSLLERAASNLPEYGDGRRIYEKFVKPARVNLEKVGAHYAICSLFDEYPDRSRVYSYDVVREDLKVAQEGRARLAVGRARITSRITEEATTLSFGTLDLGDQNVSGGVGEFRSEDAYGALVADVQEPFHRGDIPELVRAVDRNFGSGTYSLRLLFRDEQRRIIGLILDKALAEAASLYRNFYGQYATLGRFITDLGIPLPARFHMAVDFALHEDLLEALKSDDHDANRVHALLEQATQTGIQLDKVTLEFAFRRTVERAAQAFLHDPGQRLLIENFDKAVSMCPLLPFPVDLWAAQNAYHAARETRFPEFQAKAIAGDSEAQAWVRMMNALGAKLGFYIEPSRDEASQ
ncbi:MAG: DUF3536 domain-containing protein, partial [Bryobacteraceae bacterium]